MDLTSELPAAVTRLLLDTSFAEFASVSAQGLPIDTPLLSFPDEDLSKIGMATGLAYPVKAERVRRNPKVGLLYWPKYAGEPVVEVIGYAATRDRDIQANTLKYAAETAYISPEAPWEVKRKALWYWTRVLIEIRPKQILWWESEAALDQPPHRWEAPADAVYPPSDPAPPGASTPAPKWPTPDWREAARIDAGSVYPGYLSVMDDDGFPRVMRVGDVRLEDDSLSLALPAGAPGRRSGPATLTYFGRDTFVGSVVQDGARVRLIVERMLPILPFVGQGNIWDPEPPVKDATMSRLEAELERRGQPIPTLPEAPPEPSPGARRRAERDTRGADEGLFDRSNKAQD
jgi:hypothetical protein